MHDKELAVVRKSTEEYRYEICCGTQATATGGLYTHYLSSAEPDICHSVHKTTYKHRLKK
jgi:hypothetical protein